MGMRLDGTAIDWDDPARGHLVVDTPNNETTYDDVKALICTAAGMLQIQGVADASLGTAFAVSAGQIIPMEIIKVGEDTTITVVLLYKE